MRYILQQAGKFCVSRQQIQSVYDGEGRSVRILTLSRGQLSSRHFRRSHASTIPDQQCTLIHESLANRLKYLGCVMSIANSHHSLCHTASHGAADAQETATLMRMHPTLELRDTMILPLPAERLLLMAMVSGSKGRTPSTFSSRLIRHM